MQQPNDLESRAIQDLLPEPAPALPPLGEDTAAITVTFILAIAGYLGLVATTIQIARDRWPQRFWRVVATIIFAHVLMVWHYRYGWSFDLAVRNGYAGFAIFHSALAMIVAATVTPEKLARRFVLISFGIVTFGSLGAVFRYDVVAIYRIPVVVGAIIAAGKLGQSLRRRA